MPAMAFGLSELPRQRCGDGVRPSVFISRLPAMAESGRPAIALIPAGGMSFFHRVWRSRPFLCRILIHSETLCPFKLPKQVKLTYRRLHVCNFAYHIGNFFDFVSRVPDFRKKFKNEKSVDYA